MSAPSPIRVLEDDLSCPLVDRAGPFNPYRVRLDFPVLAKPVHEQRLVYLDNAATTQKPQAVIDALNDYYTTENANVHRGVHHLSQVATDSYEGGRTKIRNFINARYDREIVFVKGTTDGINLVAQTFGRQRVGEGDEIIISEMEHHSNIVPWQMLCQEKGAHLRVIPIDDDGELILEEYEKLLNPRTKLVAIAHVSNALGTVNPVEEIIAQAHEKGVPVLVDGAQAVPHFKVDVQALGCDFYTFSGHKLYAPTGTGALYGRLDLLEEMPPYQGGGSMIRSVDLTSSTYADPPTRFEAGTPHIAGVIGLGAAIDYLARIGLDHAARYEDRLLDYAGEALQEIPGLRMIGTAKRKVSVLSFIMEDVHPHDIGTILDQQGVAVRAGHHCAQPVMKRFGIPATTRASTALYNTREDIDALIKALHKVRDVFN
jgi:cysteine desulfurase/selenocysteine lyase